LDGIDKFNSHKHSAGNDKNSAENDEIKVPKRSAETGGNQLMARLLSDRCFTKILILIEHSFIDSFPFNSILHKAFLTFLSVR
jgi:hypothetical protein